MGTITVGFGLGVAVTVGAAITLASGCVSRVTAAFAGEDDVDEGVEWSASRALGLGGG